MAGTVTIYKWNRTQQFSDNFSFTTKYYDFGSSSELKNIYSISVTFGTNSEGVSMSFLPELFVDYRISTVGGFTPYATYMTNSTIDYTVNQATQTITKDIKIKKIPGIQLKVRGFISEGFLINDIAIEYRHLRRKSIGSPQ